MHCRPLPGGLGFVCGGRAQRRRCSTPECSNLAGRDCDFRVVRKGVVGTCDKALCDSCATSVGPDRDYCKPHVTRSNQFGAAAAAGAPLCSMCGSAAPAPSGLNAAVNEGTSKDPCSACGTETTGRKRGP